MLHISLVAEKIFYFWGLKITNSILTSWIVSIFLIGIALIVKNNLSEIPGKFQVVIEGIIEGLYNLFSSVNGEATKKFYPLLATLFIYIIFANWVGLLPGVGTIGFFHSEEKKIENVEQFLEEKDHEEEVKFIPLLRAPTADLNITFALAIIAVISLQFFGLKTLGKKYLSKFINFKNPIMFFVGLLEIISEFAKIISFAFRLFGNIFAGEVLLAVIAFLIPLFAPLPFLALEIFVGFIQALVFAMLTSVFLNVATHAEH